MFWQRRKSREQELERELRSHLEQETEEQVDAGSSREDAYYTAHEGLWATQL